MKIIGIISTVIAISFGVIVLLGYFLDIEPISTYLLQLATILAGVATLLGVSNLLSVHFAKMREGKSGAIYSLVMAFSFLITFILGIASLLAAKYQPEIASTTTMIYNDVLSSVMLSVEVSLLGVVSITLVYACIRLLRVRADLMSILFIISAVLTLISVSSLPFIGQLPGSDLLHAFLTQVIASGGTRGILLGISLGTLLTGLRILFGADRPYGGK